MLAGGETPSADQVRESFLKSDRYRSWTGKFPVLAMAAVPAMRPEEWSGYDGAMAIVWAKGAQVDMPEPMREYERQVKARI